MLQDIIFMLNLLTIISFLFSDDSPIFIRVLHQAKTLAFYIFKDIEAFNIDILLLFCSTLTEINFPGD